MKVTHRSVRKSVLAKHLAASLGLAVAAVLIPQIASAASTTWIGSGEDNLWLTGGNWNTGIAPGTADTAVFNNDGAGNTTVDLDAGVTVGSMLFDTANAAAYTIGLGSAGNETLTLGNAGAITVNAAVTNPQLFNSNVELSNASVATTTFTNNSSGTLTIAGVVVANGTGTANSIASSPLLTVAGSGNTTLSGGMSIAAGAHQSLLKTGAGTLTISSGSAWDGQGAIGYVPATQTGFPVVAREGTLKFAGGTHTVSGELVIGGVVANGGAGQNAKVQVDSGTLNISSWLSIGRGNGNGTATSDLEINGSGSVSTVNLSAGYNGGNTGNLPKGSITLSGSGSLTVNSTAGGTGGPTFILGESVGSNFTMTLNDSAVVNRAGGNTSLTSNAQNQGAFQIGRDGTAAVIMNGGTINVASTDLGRGVNTASTQNGTLTIKTGATYNNEGDFRTGFAGSASGRATLNLEGGELNIGTTTTRTLIVGTFDGPQSTLNIQSGNLNLNANSSLRFNQNNNVGPNVINLNGGAITSYSDNKTTADGTGVLDMMQVGAASSNNTFNLNGGTLNVRQVVSTTNNGTRTFNFNGGTLKATGATTAFVGLGTGTARANVRNGGAIIDTNGFDVTVAQALLHSNVGGDAATDGGLTKTGAGTLTVSAANTYTGSTTVNNGTLAVGASGAISSTVVLGKIGVSTGTLDVTSKTSYSLTDLSGNGTVNIGTGKTVTATGAVAPGFGVGSLNVTGGFTLQGTTTMQIAGSNGVAGTDFDLVSVTQAVTFGGTLSITSLGGYDLGTANKIYQLFSAGSFAGNFSSVSVGGTAMTYNAGTDSWSAVGYTFDEVTGRLLVVPEPSTFAMLLGGMGMLGVFRRNRRK